MLSGRFDDALRYAADLHRHERRHGSDTPFIAHPLAVAALVIENGGTEDTAIAALLHDAFCTARKTDWADAIAASFGPQVLEIVKDYSRGQEDDGPDWRSRKQAYIAAIPAKSDPTVLITLCDKLHNATAILQNLIAEGLSVFDGRPGRRDGTLWYYRELAEVLQKRSPGPLATRLSATVGQIEYWVGTAE